MGFSEIPRRERRGEDGVPAGVFEGLKHHGRRRPAKAMWRLRGNGQGNRDSGIQGKALVALQAGCFPLGVPEEVVDRQGLVKCSSESSAASTPGGDWLL